MTNMVKSVAKISNMSPTHFVSNIRKRERVALLCHEVNLAKLHLTVAFDEYWAVSINVCTENEAFRIQKRRHNC